ncbi:hypothetical protein AAFF_G00354710 [Aldrovandia affinis]|uniref:Reverse transcriptase/retrotransposon-derived protein RNase H-like domain-containing protein n=1 Tax=Aldrovandia affinis TaxID=143900 RepID=A0AAD7SIM9_9TELE|nr:hypothetical protein AAFF_G00354710 [Aldrovandia affinis]
MVLHETGPWLGTVTCLAPGAGDPRYATALTKNKTELQSFLGLLIFYSCFLPNKATILEPLHRLLDQSASWQWSDAHKKAYNTAKQLLQSEDVLAHYDETKPLALVCDASPYGLGALLFHVEPNGREAPICFASRTLTSMERNYAQIDKEALAVIFAVKEIHQYISGRHFVVFTDHKPLLGLLHHSKPMPAVLSPCMLRWSVLLGAYDYELSYRPGKQLANADALSRLPLPTTETETPPPLEVLLLEMVPEAPLHATRIAALTLKDPVLSRVLCWVLHGWPTEVPDSSFKPFISRHHELSAHKNCLLWGSRVVIPNLARKEVLAMLRDAHPGIVHMKGLARSYAWWPDIIVSDNGASFTSAEFQEFSRRNGIRHTQLPQSLEIMVTCQGYLRNHHWNRPHLQGQEH